ncbi:hypothetical protein [Micromonospora sp. NBC_01796]|uniref:hypothetical protein n=1 Tax=Micromonospora sp. NBC_01796 TaxID=2975987 RepID=UPI002DD934F9|nr:hypothetical protein [Micromonospora sp. NBC_01796]WSA82808.1 hypothetical protein OIE47_20405 [Micromonospora sp. NBC_01796]
MPKHDHDREQQTAPTPEVVARNLGGAYWSVDLRSPALPEHLADLVAPPIVVGAAPVPASALVAMSPVARRRGGRHRRTAPTG